MKRVLTILMAFALGFAAESASTIPWRVPAYSLTARGMDVREALDTFGVAQGIPVIRTQAVKGVFSGNFRDVPAAEFLDRLTTMHNLTWYYDGATLFISSTGETLTTLIDLRYMKAGEVLAMMRELGVEDARYPLKSASNDELIMVSGPPRYVALVAEMIGKADKLREQRTFAEVETRIFPLKNTWADSVNLHASSGTTESYSSIKGVAQLLQEIMGASNFLGVREGTNQTGRATAEEVASTGVTQPIIRPENRLNAVVIRDIATRMPLYERLIRELDHPQKLVEISVTKLEMAQGDALDWEASVKVDFADERNLAFAGQNASTLLSTAGEAALAGLTGGYSYLGDHVNVSASIYALKENGKARGITRSSLLTLANLSAEMSDTQSYNARLVGEKVASVTETSAGTRLFIKPRIVEPPPGATNAIRQVWLTMEVQDGGFDYDDVVDGMPTKSTTIVETQAALPEGHSLLVAGNFHEVESESAWGIPFFRDIPWIGWIFGGATKTKSTVQRLFVLTPHIIDMPRFSASTTNDLAETQALRNRDTAREEVLVDVIDRDMLGQRERKAKQAEARAIYHEALDEEHERNNEERDLRALQRRLEREIDHAVWEEDFEARKDAMERDFKDARDARRGK